MIEKIEKISVMESKDVINIVRNTLKLVDTRLMDHGTRVAYILHGMLKYCDHYDENEISNICNLGIFHDIGAYKTEEIDQMMVFESKNFLDHSIYGYLFVKWLTPLGDLAEAILYHHFDFKDLKRIHTEYEEIALLLHLADRVDALMQASGRVCDYDKLQPQDKLKFDPQHIEWLKRCEEEDQILTKVCTGEYAEEIQRLLEKLQFTNKEINQYLKMLIYSIDFRSVVTVNHTVNTIFISLEIAKLLQFRMEDRAKIYYGALLHDVGKIAIPLNILEFPGKLTSQQMEIMKTHVDITGEIINGIIDDEICQIALRHHEKIDGSGYPFGLNEDDLTPAQQIVALADIMSALASERSYKKPFPPEKIKQILKEMSEEKKLCSNLVKIVLEHYEAIMKAVNKASGKTLEIYFNLMKEYIRLQKRFAGFF